MELRWYEYAKEKGMTIEQVIEEEKEKQNENN